MSKSEEFGPHGCDLALFGADSGRIIGHEQRIDKRGDYDVGAACLGLPRSLEEPGLYDDVLRGHGRSHDPADQEDRQGEYMACAHHSPPLSLL